VAQTLEQSVAPGDQQDEQDYGDHPQRLARRRRRKLGRALNAWMLMSGVLLDGLDLLIALGLRTMHSARHFRVRGLFGLRISKFVLCTHA
jgi:hypothetical protein